MYKKIIIRAKLLSKNVIVSQPRYLKTKWPIFQSYKVWSIGTFGMLTGLWIILMGFLLIWLGRFWRQNTRARAYSQTLARVQTGAAQTFCLKNKKWKTIIYIRIVCRVLIIYGKPTEAPSAESGVVGKRVGTEGSKKSPNLVLIIVLTIVGKNNGQLIHFFFVLVLLPSFLLFSFLLSFVKSLPSFLACLLFCFLFFLLAFFLSSFFSCFSPPSCPFPSPAIVFHFSLLLFSFC